MHKKSQEAADALKETSSSSSIHSGEKLDRPDSPNQSIELRRNESIANLRAKANEYLMLYDKHGGEI